VPVATRSTAVPTPRTTAGRRSPAGWLSRSTEHPDGPARIRSIIVALKATPIVWISSQDFRQRASLEPPVTAASTVN